MCLPEPPHTECKYWIYVKSFRDDSHKFNQIHHGKEAGVDVGQGVCMALSVLWLKLHMTQKTRGSGEALRRQCMVERNDHFKKAEPLEEAVELHEDYRKVAGRRSVRSGLELLTNKTQLNFGDNVREQYNSDSDLNNLSIRVGGTHRYSVIGMNFSKGAHAIATYKSGGKIFGLLSHLYVFDPNYGEFLVPSGSIAEFLKNLFECYVDTGHQINTWDYWNITRV